MTVIALMSFSFMNIPYKQGSDRTKCIAIDNFRLKIIINTKCNVMQWQDRNSALLFRTKPFPNLKINNKIET